MKNCLANQTILVTGCAHGIGRAVALDYAQNGATLILLDRDVKALEQLYDEILAQNSPQAAICPIDLAGATENDYRDLAERVAAEFGQLDGLLHNAAITGRLTPIEHYNVKQWYAVIQVNLHAAFLLTQAMLPLLKKAPAAKIVFTTADEGETGKAYTAAYAASKFALQGFAQVLSNELYTNTQITVNTINPGVVNTNLRRQTHPAENPESLPSVTSVLSQYLQLMLEQPDGLLA